MSRSVGIMAFKRTLGWTYARAPPPLATLWCNKLVTSRHKTSEKTHTKHCNQMFHCTRKRKGRHASKHEKGGIKQGHKFPEGKTERNAHEWKGGKEGSWKRGWEGKHDRDYSGNVGKKAKRVNHRKIGKTAQRQGIRKRAQACEDQRGEGSKKKRYGLMKEKKKTQRYPAIHQVSDTEEIPSKRRKRKRVKRCSRHEN